jgi:hypothetical protein
MSVRRLAVMAALIGAATGHALARQGNENGSDEPVSYWRQIRPLLQTRCVGCHQPAKAKGGHVLVDHRSLLARNADGDAALVVPGQPGSSALLDSVTAFDGEPPAMPKDGAPLDTTQVELLRRWIAEGAHDDSPAVEGPPVTQDNPPIYEQAPVLTSLAWSPNGELLAVSGYHEVLLLDGTDRHLVARLVGLAERIESIAFNRDGSLLAVVGGSPARMGEVQVWDVATRTLKVSATATFDCLYGASWSPDGRLIAFGASDKSVRAIDAKSGQQVLFSGAHDDWVLGTAFSLDGAHVVSVSRDRTMKLVQVATQQFIDDITSITPGVQKGGLMAVARHPARDELLIGGADGVPRLYRMFREQARKIGDDFNLLRTFAALPGRVFAVAFSADGERVAVGSSNGGNGEVRIYQTADGVEVCRYAGKGGIFTVAFAPDGRTLAAGGFSGEVILLDSESGAVRHQFVPVPLGPSDAALTQSGEEQ